ncbi:hypothetical protein IU500_32980 [Nocardia terpenica]|uniref:hypothetical protein n=1 Tax=Nocardia terpenica TaxID=455432 RepID=UPI0008330628|nr:hypothetical protein [Nocardia terpenica]MBF6065970.1 hypothetical protein [Nocardia terpenica]MBF6108834.1 hypothetical protein [Nocardia terpenica]MBF6116214.1 hypothetical protein [Nocardia terpenica]MBF6123215.1 hypothetical protein [Nocardia terpenica]MBF6153103.1 hypothetical protein [Nocardia terpenica]
MSQRRLRWYGRAVLGEITLPRPFSVQVLCDSIARQRRRRLYLHPLSEQSGEGAPCGMWIATDVADHIFYEQKTSSFHQDHIILHEIGHILCGHNVTRLVEQEYPLLADGTADEVLTRRALARTSYTTRQEQEAEMVASLILERAATVQANPVTGSEWRLGAALGAIDHV